MTWKQSLYLRTSFDKKTPDDFQSQDKRGDSSQAISRSLDEKWTPDHSWQTYRKVFRNREISLV